MEKSDGEVREPGAAIGLGGAGRQDALLPRLIAQRLPPEPALEQVLAIHECALGALWLQLAPLMGHSGAQAVFARAIQLACRKAPSANGVQAGATGLDFAAMRAAASAASAADEAAALSVALTVLAEAVDALIISLLGPGLARSLLRDVELTTARTHQIEPGEPPAARPDGEEGSQP